MSASVYLSVVLPAYNEAGSIRTTLAAMRSFLDRQDVSGRWQNCLPWNAAGSENWQLATGTSLNVLVCPNDSSAVNLGGGLLTEYSQLTDLGGDHGEAAAVFAGAGRFYRSVQR